METFGMMRRWNYRDHSKYYDQPCGNVVGSGGEFWPPKRTKEDSIMLFAPDLCRLVAIKNLSN